jgi:flagellar hook-associated protein 3 FlgL
VTVRFSTQASVDVRRITTQLSELQGQIASQAQAKDLQGFGGASSRILNARGLKASSDARYSVLNQLQARFGVQAAALGQVANASNNIAQAIRDAISSNDGRGIATELGLSFTSIVSALNETWNGNPIKVTSLEQLQTTAGPNDIFDEAARHQTIDFGTGSPIVLAAKASELSQGLFDALKQLKDLVDASGGEIGQPIDVATTAALQNLADAFAKQSNNFTTEEGRTGQIDQRFDDERSRLVARSDLLDKQIGDQVDVDIGEISIKINALMAQYQAAAKSFADLSKLTLLDYL